MEKKVKTPFFWTRVTNMIIGFVILTLILALISTDGQKKAIEIWIFVLAAVENFISATISFSEQKRLRGHVSAVISAVFLVAALVGALRYFGII